MRKSLPYSAESAVPNRIQETALPTIVRNALSAALITGSSIGCVSQNQSETPMNIPVLEVAGPETTLEYSEDEGMEPAKNRPEKVAKNPYFTPQKAVRDALSGPLQFVAKFEEANNPFDIFDIHHACLWKNDRVLVKTDNCNIPQPVNGTITKDEWAAIAVHSPNGETIEIRAKAPSNQPLTGIERDQYESFEIEYLDYSKINPNFRQISIPEKYKKFMQNEGQPGARYIKYSPDLRYCIQPWPLIYGVIDYPLVEAECKNMEDKNIEPIINALEAFWKDPGEDWYSFLRNMNELRSKYGYR